MKKLIYFLLPLLFLGLASCEKDDSDPYLAEIQGTWESRVLNTYLDVDYVTQYIFLSDGTFTERHTIHEKDQVPVKYLLYDGKGRFETNGKVISVDRFNYKYSANGNIPPDPLVQGEKEIEFEIAYELILDGTRLFVPSILFGGALIQEQTFVRQD